MASLSSESFHTEPSMFSLNLKEGTSKASDERYTMKNTILPSMQAVWAKIFAFFAF